MNLSGDSEFIEASELMHRYGKRVAMETYHQPGINEVVHRNYRIGTGITENTNAFGCLQARKAKNSNESLRTK